MNKKFLVASVIIVLILGLGIILYTRRPSPVSPNNTAQQTPVGTLSESTKWAEAIKSGTPTTCTMTKGTDKMEYLIQGKKMRANMSVTTLASPAPKILVSHLINDEQFLYMWQDGQVTGTKTSLTQPSPSPLADENNTTNVPKFDDQNSYDNLKSTGYTVSCSVSSFDSSVFVPPADVKFQDPSEMMKQVTPSGANNQMYLQKMKDLQKQYGY